MSPQSVLNRHLIGNRVKITRVSKGLSQLELANLLNCDRTTISRYETGKQEIPASILFEIGRILGCSIELFNPYTKAIASSQFFADFD